MPLLISSSLIGTLLSEARSAHPDECCGILLGSGETISAIRRASNIHDTPQTHFTIDPQALIDAQRDARDGELDIVGYYHSHPNGLAQPSATDRAQSAKDGAIWAIIANHEVSFWRDGDDGFETVPYRRLPR